MTDGEAYLVEQPVPLGPRGYDDRKKAGHLPFSRFFDSAVWTGRRHAMVTPTQIDRFGQINLQPARRHAQAAQNPDAGRARFSGQHHLPSQQLLLPRAHDRACSWRAKSIWSRASGYNPAKRVPGGNYSGVDLRCIVTNLCVMDFGGEANAVRVVSLHPGVSFDEVQAATGFALVNAVDGRDGNADGGAAGDHIRA